MNKKEVIEQVKELVKKDRNNYLDIVSAMEVASDNELYFDTWMIEDVLEMTDCEGRTPRITKERAKTILHGAVESATETINEMIMFSLDDDEWVK